MKGFKTMDEKYKVVFRVKNEGGRWESESFSNGGRGVDLMEAIEIKQNLDRYGLDGAEVRNVIIVKL